MWTIVSINNETHVLKVRHADGEIMDLVVPESERRTPADKMAYIKSQTDARDVVKAKIAKKKSRKPLLLYAIMLAEAATIIALLMRH